MQARSQPGKPDDGRREGQRGDARQPPGQRTPAPGLLDQHQGGQPHHGGHVHHAHRDQDDHQPPAAAQAEAAVVDADSQVTKPAPVRAVVHEQPERRAAVGQAAVLERAQLVRPAQREDSHRRDMRRVRMSPGQPAREPGQAEGGQARRGPHREVAGHQAGDPRRPVALHGPRVQGGHRGHRRQHHRRHHQRPHRHERHQAQPHRAGHPGHPAGQADGRGPGGGRHDQQEGRLDAGRLSQRRRSAQPGAAHPGAVHPDHENGAENPLWPSRPQSIPNVDRCAVLAGATVSVVFDGWSTSVSRTGS